MKNKLFQLARSFVEKAKVSKRSDDRQKAKNNLSSAFANSTFAEQKQLRKMQEELRP